MNTNTTATGGYLEPTYPQRYPGGLTFRQFLQTVFVGISGLPTDLVRPKWQRNPPKQPDVGIDWLAIGLGVNKPDYNAYVGMVKATQATGFLSFICNPEPGDTVTINGVLIRFVAANPMMNQVVIGADTTATAINLVALLSTSLDPLLTIATYSDYLGEVDIQAFAFGPSGNSFTLAYQFSCPESLVLSAPTLTGGANNGNTTQRHEDLEIKCSFYGPNSDEVASATRDGFQIGQNLQNLRLANMGFVATNEGIRVPELVNERWIDRFELSVFLRRERLRTYPILTFVSASGTILNDQGARPINWSTNL